MICRLQDVISGVWKLKCKLFVLLPFDASLTRATLDLLGSDGPASGSGFLRF
jgi:hypothetical protein